MADVTATYYADGTPRSVHHSSRTTAYAAGDVTTIQEVTDAGVTPAASNTATWIQPLGLGVTVASALL